MRVFLYFLLIIATIVSRGKAEDIDAKPRGHLPIVIRQT